jgi:hypothetical protein
VDVVPREFEELDEVEGRLDVVAELADRSVPGGFAPLVPAERGHRARDAYAAAGPGRAVSDHHQTGRRGRTVLIVCSSASRRAARTSPSFTWHSQHRSVGTQHIASRTSASS